MAMLGRAGRVGLVLASGLARPGAGSVARLLTPTAPRCLAGKERGREGG